MNGIVFIEIGKFAQTRLGEQAWREVVAIAEPSCMLRGDPACRLIVKCRPL